MPSPIPPETDVFIIGGGVNGCGIARDAAGRGLSVALAEQGDLAQATSSASTKLLHGGLRYLEYFEFRLVREALAEREILLRIMPHISWPLRFVLPYHPDMRFDNSTPASKWLGRIMPWMRGRRPAWLIRLGLFLYDHMGARKILPPTRVLDLTKDTAGQPLKPMFSKAYEYSDCWVDDARLVILNARDAAARGAHIMPRRRVIKACQKDGLWEILTENPESSEPFTHRAKVLINVAGPWAGHILPDLGQPVEKQANIRLVRGSHIVTHRLFEHDRSYFFQGEDGRIIFAIPYEQDFTLLGTTDQDHTSLDDPPECTAAERDYLLDFATRYFARPVTQEDIVWSFSGVRPLYDDGAGPATAATREYVIKLDKNTPPLLSIFGGKITTYRRLAEAALREIKPLFPNMTGSWTAQAALPGGDFAHTDGPELLRNLTLRFPFITPYLAQRLIRSYGRDSFMLLDGATSLDDLGQSFGAGLYEAEVIWMMSYEWAQTAEDVLWRRSKLGLRLSPQEVATLAAYMKERRDQIIAHTNEQSDAHQP